MWQLLADLLGFGVDVGANWPLKGTLPPLRFHNTLSNSLEVFTPLSPREVKMYNCGPTVYDYVHIGNLRSYVFADLIRRSLDAWGYRVKQVINITDFGHLVSDGDEGEDKMTKALKREGLALTLKNMRTLAERYTEAFLKDLDSIGIHTNGITFPRASDYVTEQVALIKALEQKGYAYKTSDGIYFETAKFANYGKLGNRDIERQQEGTRLASNPEKKNPNDFALWKFDKSVGWPSPWGKGFPGWHIECTAMIFTLLGKHIDIHTGGIDHIAVHHNNEIAQAEAITKKPFASLWMHNEFITIEGKRVGKSEGNAILLKSLVDRGLSPRALRYWFLTGHYRTPMNFSWDAITGAHTALTRLTRFYFEELGRVVPGEIDTLFMQDFAAAIADDLDTPRAIALMWELIKNPTISPESKRASLLAIDRVLGLGLSEKRASNKLSVTPEPELPSEVAELAARRETARMAKDFAAADELREKLAGLGYEVKDTLEGQKLSPLYAPINTN